MQEFAKLFSDSRYGKATVPRLWNLERCGMYVPIPKEFTSIMQAQGILERQRAAHETLFAGDTENVDGDNRLIFWLVNILKQKREKRK